MNQQTKPAPRNRVLAGVLALVYAALFALAGYLESIRIEDCWPTWALVVGGVTGLAVLLVLPFIVVKYFFGIDLSPIWHCLLRFSLRGMLLSVLGVSILAWYLTHMHWNVQRHLWRSSNSATASFTQGRAPLALRLIGETGESRIEIKNGTREQIAVAKRLFPEAIVVAATEPGPNQGK